MFPLINKLFKELVKAVFTWLLLTVFWGGAVQAALPPDTLISNTVSASYQIGETVVETSATKEIRTAVETPSKIKLFIIVDETRVHVPQSWYLDSSNNWVSTQSLSQSTTGNETGSEAVLQTSSFLVDQGILVELEDIDQNLNPNEVETIEITVANANGEDQEVFRFSETGVSTGVFRGLINVKNSGDVISGDGFLTADKGLEFVVNYKDNDSQYKDDEALADTSSISGVFEPSGTVYSGESGELLSGAQIKLFDAKTKRLAEVHAPGGNATWPNPVISGSVVKDSLGNEYEMQAGEYFFPHAAPGEYYVQVIPPKGYLFPYLKPQTDGEPLPTGSRGEPFEVDDYVALDIPLGINQSRVTLAKSVDKSKVSLGEVVQYTLNVTNNDTIYPAQNIKIIDALPSGFHLIKSSIKQNGNSVSEDKISFSERKFYLSIDDIEPATSARITYLTRVSAGAKPGDAINTAVVNYSGSESNPSSAEVLVVDDLMRVAGILTGRVFLGCDKKDLVEGVRIYTESGRNVLTDNSGLWHMHGVKFGAHIVKLDTYSLNGQYRPVLCKDTTRNNRSATSVLVDMKGSSIEHTDFFVELNKDWKAEQASKALAEKIPEVNVKLADGVNEDVALLWPPEDHIPAISSLKAIVAHHVKYRVNVKLNGEAVNYYHFDKRMLNSKKTHAIQLWKGIDIQSGINKLTIDLIDKNKQVIKTINRRVIFSGAPVEVSLLADQSNLLADGKKSAVLAFQLLDENGFRVRPGSKVYFSLESREYQIESKDETLSTEIKKSLLVDPDGIVRIRLEPTTKSGDVGIRFYLKDDEEALIKARLKPDYRDWIMVGFARGQVGYSELNDKLMPHLSQNEDDLTYQSQIKFFAKGRIRGNQLLTIAYDSSGYLSKPDADETIDPDAWYNVYGDQSISQYEADSDSRLYIKLEKNQFIALFGNKEIELDQSRLGGYERKAHGLYSEYNGDRVGYVWFANRTDQVVREDKIQGRDISGEYFLSHDILPDSESVKLETYHFNDNDDVLESLTLTRHIDYEINYDRKSLFFKNPVPSRENDNPVYIVVRYESESDIESVETGGRLSTQLIPDKVEMGFTALYQKNDLTGDDNKASVVVASDLTWKASKETTLSAEVGKTVREEKEVQAWTVNVENKTKNRQMRAYASDIEEGYGIDSQSISGQGRTKLGVESKWKINDSSALDFEAFKETLHKTDAERRLLQIKGNTKVGKATVSVGAKRLEDDESSRDQIILGGSVPLTEKLTAKIGYIKNVNSESVDDEKVYDSVTTQFDYVFNKDTTASLKHEIELGEGGEERTSVGFQAKPWKNNTLSAFFNDTESSGDTGREVSQSVNLGMQQKIEVQENLHVDLKVNHVKQLSEVWDELESSTDTSGDHTTYTLLGKWQHEQWKVRGKGEYYQSDDQESVTSSVDVNHLIKEGIEFNLGLDYLDSETVLQLGKVSRDRNIQLEIGVALRPVDQDFHLLQKLVYIDSETGTEGNESHEQSLRHNLHYTYTWDNATAIQLQHAVKYTTQDGYETLIDSAHIGVREDITPKIGIGVHAGYLRDHSSDVNEYNLGASMTYTTSENSWLTMGYNVSGYDNDKNILNDQKTGQGAYLNFIYRFD